MKYLTWDIGILAALGLLLAYSLLIRKHKSLATLVCVYIGFVMANAWGERASAFFSGDRVFLSQMWIKANASPFVVQAVLMVGITFLVSSFVKLGGRRSRYSALEVAVYAICTMALAVMFLISFMSPEMREHAFAASRILPLVHQFREWVLAVPIVAVIFFGLYSEDE
jgi:hypothetical protein